MQLAQQLRRAYCLDVKLAGALPLSHFGSSPFESITWAKLIFLSAKAPIVIASTNFSKQKTIVV
jgi:hypothetical protein